MGTTFLLFLEVKILSDQVKIMDSLGFFSLMADLFSKNEALGRIGPLE